MCLCQCVHTCAWKHMLCGYGCADVSVLTVCCVWVKEKEKEIYPSFRDLREQLLQQIRPALDLGTEIKSDCFLFLLLFWITAPWWETAAAQHKLSFTAVLLKPTYLFFYFFRWKLFWNSKYNTSTIVYLQALMAHICKPGLVRNRRRITRWLKMTTSFLLLLLYFTTMQICNIMKKTDKNK